MDTAGVFITVRAFVCVLGIAANLLLLLATSNLRKPLNVCSLLIAADALTVLLYSASGPISLGTFLSIQHFGEIRLLALCVPFQALPLTGFFLNRATIFFISFDRFLSVLFPIWYKGRNHLLYIASLGLSASIYLVANWALILREDFRVADTQVWCAMTDLFQGLVGPISQSILGLCLLSVLLYSLIWLKLRGLKKRRKQQEKQGGPNYTERMFTSLVAILVSILFGSVLSSLVKTLLSFVQFSPQTEYIVNNASSLLSVFNSGCHPLILHTFSKEYRNAINCVFSSLFCCKSTSNSIVSLQSVAVSQQNSALPNNQQASSLPRNFPRQQNVGGMINVG